MAAGVGVDLGVQHHHFDVGTVLQDDFGDVLEADVSQSAVAADDPHFGQFFDFLIGHESVVQPRQPKVFFFGDHVFVAFQQVAGEAFGDDGSTGMLDDEGFAEQPADGGAVLKEGVHPRVGMGVGGRGGSVDGIATGAGAHKHHGHAVGHSAVDRLEFFVVESVGSQGSAEGVHEFPVDNFSAIGNPLLSVCVVFAAESHHDVGYGLPVKFVFLAATVSQFGEFFGAFGLQSICDGAKAGGFGVIERAHVGFGYGTNRAKDALFPATGASAVA